ncbi:PREDICTED: uncharacterized protein LOC104723879 isoform X5 [Camelina sativa]|uniref:Uncharacterized protein LOC104723879 isoform X5 n=1 Tax=Camelina sativa TaxID=90675 RepID=A0ABM1QLT0_CAMSA|nr:PREDICTED: uncharacterized protein LOC104723879 isoform X5 [Camelina sativa]
MEENLAKPASKRTSIKSQFEFDFSIRKQKFRENCFRRVREDRTRLLWKLRLSDCQSSDRKEIINSAFQDIVTDELKKFEDSSRNLSGNQTVTPDCDDILWEYEEQGLKAVYEGSYVQIQTWEDEEDDYLATLVSQNMCLNSELELKQIWCPICNKGELMENHRHIYCNMCNMQVNKGQEVNLDILQERLAEAHAEHLERGCRLKPEFSVQTNYNLKALYITCEACSTFEVVV